ncbi:hypothetical protein KP509_21G066000 [Ceratopteris richardii]|uniref:Mandelate racemase/muconate lactonizing enzyme C-terminal domain-containing protein n=2 Tax=Ceratopteris richardii TaxID=49495 RepID=A0A8T2SCU4_CERRI|nr:hypothetical protein KP509_1Z241600 [Ceratopteris richardii]KAH7315796.1 hypothetical protein KP509_21G066000 [Ceratopteris richardii]
MPATIFPSVRCGLEMGILGALAASNGTNFAGLLDGQSSYKNFDRHQNSPDAQLMSQKIRICGLLDSSGSPSEMALSALQLVQQGFCTLKVKVARRVSPVEDAAVLLAIRKAVGPKVHLRADANQRWTLAQALEFASAVQGCGLQYLEEPVKNRYDLVKFCKETGLPVAVDESIDKNVEDLHEYFSDLRLAAVVIKPSSVGGFERAAMIVKWAQRNGMLAIISSAFESSVGLAIYAQFSMFVDAQHMKSISMTDNYKSSTWSNVIISPVAHGLGTYMWLQDDVVLENRFSVQRRENGVEVSMEDCERVIQNLVFNRETVDVHSNNVVSLHSGTHLVNSAASEFRFHVMDTHTTSETDSKLPVLVFLHGFLGNCRDWMPIMQALSVSHRCISVDLPGHGKTCLERERISNGALITADPFSMESIANAINTLLSKLTAKKVILVGYSMGARLALYMALRSNQKVCAAVIISGSPGLERQSDRRVRAIQDSALAVILQEAGLQSFVDDWYQKPMWKSLRSHPQFVSLKASRTQHVDVKSLAKILCSMSLGRQPSLWKDLADPPVPLLFVAGKNDEKFVGLAHKMYNTIDSQKLRKSATLEEVCSECACLRLEQQPKYYQIESGLSCHDTQKGSVESEETRRFLLEEALVLQSDKFAKRECKNCKFVNLLRLDKTGHSVHVENPCLLINGISKFVTQFMQTSKQEPKG